MSGVVKMQQRIKDIIKSSSKINKRSYGNWQQCSSSKAVYKLNTDMVARWVREFKRGKQSLDTGNIEVKPTSDSILKENKQLSHENE